MVPVLQGFGPYRLLHVLGEGEVCTVYRAIKDANGASGREIALAIVHPIGAADKEAVEAFVQRSEGAIGFHHQRVAATLEAGALEGRAYAVRELAPGVALADLLPKRSKGLKPAEARLVLLAVLESLVAASAFSEGFVHGRLDAGDVLLEADGTIKVSGFGQADAPPGADLLAVAGLAQRFCNAWPVALDAWIDRVQGDGEDAFTSPAEALEALVTLTVEGDDSAARAVARRVARRLKKASPNVAQGSTAPEETPEPTARAKRRPKGQPPEATRAQRRSGSDRRQGQRREGPRRGTDQDVELASGIRQARWVAAICGIALLTAVVLELTRHVG